MSLHSVAPKDTCEIVLRNFDKTKRGKFLMSPVLYPLRYFDSFKNIILIITADITREKWLVFLRRQTKKKSQDDFSQRWDLVKGTKVFGTLKRSGTRFL